LHKFKIKYPHIDLEPHISKTTKYFQDCIHRRLSAIEDNLKSCPVKHDGTVINFLILDVQFKLLYECICLIYYLGIHDDFKPLVQKPDTATVSEADGFMKRLQILKMKASKVYGAS